MQIPPAPLDATAEGSVTSHSSASAIAISVIVPVYNIAAYLDSCLQSLVAQQGAPTYEIILVDDGSTDGSSEICQQWAEQHPSLIRFIQQAVNQGVSVARNTALEQVRGDYFAFVDGDDLLPPEALQQLYRAAKAHNADIVKGNNDIFNDKRCRPANYNSRKLRVVQGDDILATFYEHRLVRGHTWGKLFRSSLLAHVQNQPGVAMAQDTLYCAELFSLASQLVLIPDTIYQYRLRTGSSTNRKYETGAYRWWLYSIEQSGIFAHTHKQKCQHKALQVRTLIQISKEARHLNNNSLASVLSEIRQRQSRWHLRTIWQPLRQGLKPRWLLSFLQLSILLAKLERRINGPLTPSSAH